MEAATPLRHPRITVLANRVLVDGLSIDDPTAVELVRARVEAGDDPARIVADAVEIGARVLHREQTGANVEFVKTEFEKSARAARHRVRRALPQGGRAARPEVRGGLRAGERARQPRAGAPLRRRVVGRGPEPREGDADRGERADPRGPAQAVRLRLRGQPARGLPARLARGGQAVLRPARRAAARDARGAGRGPHPARARAGGEGEGRGGRARGRARHREGPLVRGGRLRRARRDRGRGRATTATRSAM